MTEDLLEILFEARVEWHDSSRVNFHVRDIATACVFPSCLSREDQVRVINSQDCCEDGKEEQDHNEHHVDCLDVIPLPPNNINCHIRVVKDSLSMTIEG